MSTRTPFTPSRRHFLQAAAAVSATAGWAGRAMAGPAGGAISAQRYAIDLGGESPHWLRSVTLPGYALEDDRYERGMFKASYAVSQSSALLDWVMALARREVDVRPGAVVVVDQGFDVKRRVEWSGGRVVQIALPVLSAKEAKRVFTVDFVWDAASFARASSGEAKATTISGKNAWNTENYRVSGLPGGNEFVTSIALPTVTAKPGAADKKTKPAPTLGELTLEFASRSRDAVLGYVENVIADARLTEGEFLDLSVEMLDPSLSKTLGTVRLYGCGLKSYAEAPYEASREGTDTFALKFAVSRVDIEA